jgi:hypothetical protein
MKKRRFIFGFRVDANCRENRPVCAAGQNTSAAWAVNFR